MGAVAEVMVDRRSDRSRAGPTSPVRKTGADRVDAGDVSDSRAAGEGHRPAVVQREERRDAGTGGEAGSEQPPAPVDRQAEGVGQDVAGGEHALPTGDPQRLVTALCPHHAARVRAHEWETAGAREPGSLRTLRRLGSRGRGRVHPAGQPTASQRGGRSGDPLAHTVGTVHDDQVDLVGRLPGDADAHPRRGPGLTALGPAGERAPALAMRADELNQGRSLVTHVRPHVANWVG